MTKFKHSCLYTILTNQNSLHAKLTADSIRGMLANIRFKIFRPLVFYMNIKIYRTQTLPIVWHGWGTRSLTLKEGQRLRVFEHRLLREIRGSKTLEVTGGWRKLQNKEFYESYASPNIFPVTKARPMKWAGHKTHTEEKRNACGVLVGKPERQRPLGRPTRRLDNIEMHLKKTEQNCWLRTGTRGVVDTATNVWVP
jgi:hypothetical protein